MDRDSTRIDWLLAFLATDIASLKPGALSDLRHEVFLHLHADQQALRTDVDERGLRPLDGPKRIAEAKDRLTGVQQKLNEGLKTLQPERAWSPFPGPAPRWSVECDTDGIVQRAYMGDWKTITLAGAIDVLLDWWPRLRRCKRESCGRVFRPVDPRQRFHQQACSDKDRYETWKPKRGEQEKKNREYRAKRKTAKGTR